MNTISASGRHDLFPSRATKIVSSTCRYRAIRAKKNRDVDYRHRTIRAIRAMKKRGFDILCEEMYSLSIYNGSAIFLNLYG